MCLVKTWTGQAMLFPRSGAALAQACVAIWGSIGLETMVSKELSEPGEKWGQNSFPGPAWPCGFTVATCFFVSRWNCKNQVTEVGSRTEAGAKTFLVLNGFSRDVLTSAPGEKWGENSSLGPARPCLRWPRRVLQSEEALGWKPWFPKNRSWTKNLISP